VPGSLRFRAERVLPRHNGIGEHNGPRALRLAAVALHTVCCLALCGACFPASTVAAQQADKPTTQQTPQPLATFAAQRVSVMPVQFFRADSAAPVRAPDWARVRKELDDSLGAAIAERGIGRKWAYAADIDRMARRNATYANDPYALGAGGLRGRALKPEDKLSPVLVGNLRALIALGDSRFALIPVELSFARSGAESRATLRLVLVDGRAGQVVWAGDVAGDAGAAFSAAGVGALAQRVADLVAGR